MTSQAFIAGDLTGLRSPLQGKQRESPWSRYGSTGPEERLPARAWQEDGGVGEKPFTRETTPLPERAGPSGMGGQMDTHDIRNCHHPKGLAQGQRTAAFSPSRWPVCPVTFLGRRGLIPRVQQQDTEGGRP